MAMFHTDVLDNQIKALPTIATASGAVANFTTDKAENLVDCEVAIVATGGGGTPTTPIPIVGYSACNLSHSDADTSNPTVYNIPFGQTIYGGVLNVGSGVLRLMNRIGLVPTITNYSSSGGHNYTYFSPTGMKSESGSHFDVVSEVVSANGSLGDYFTIYRINTLCVIGVPDNYSLSDYNSEIANTKVMYPLETPQTIQLDSTTIQTIANSENNIWSDTGDISVQFILSVGSYVNQNT